MNKALFVAILLLAAGAASAQGFYGPRSDYYSDAEFYRPSIGIEAGVSITNTINAKSPYFATSSITGFNAGITFDLPVIYPVSFAPEILYSQKGFSAVTVNGNFTQRSQFLDVPLLARLKIGQVINLYLGPQFSYLAALNNTYKAGFVTANESLYNNNSNKIFYAGVIGASFSVTGNIAIRARYTVDLQQNYSNGNAYVPGYRNQVLQFGLGYKF